MLSPLAYFPRVLVADGTPSIARTTCRVPAVIRARARHEVRGVSPGLHALEPATRVEMGIDAHGDPRIRREARVDLEPQPQRFFTLSLLHADVGEPRLVALDALFQ